MKRAMFLTVLCLLSAVNMHAELRYYVAPNGSDDAKGTIYDPFATLEKVRNMIRDLSPEERRQNIRVITAFLKLTEAGARIL